MTKNTKLLKAVAVLFVFLATSLYSFSQTTIRVSGKVTDPSGNPLEGASVSVKGSTNATSTDKEGRFVISVSSGNATLIVTSIGYAIQEVPLGGKTEVTIGLAVSNASMEDVVVIGYCTRKRTDLTGSVAGINQKDIRSRPVDNALQAMQGKVAGVDITSNERPGTVGSINIRGVRSLTASNSPLFVVDGIPLSTGGIDYLNPNDIESIDVLKDA